MAFGFLMKQELQVLRLEDQKDAMRAQRPVFSVQSVVSCYFSRLKRDSQQQEQGLEETETALAITPVLEEEPDYVRHGDTVFKVKRITKHSGFGSDHWELELVQFLGQAQVN